MTLRDDYEHWARSFPRRMGAGWGVFLDAITTLVESSGTMDHTLLNNIGTNSHVDLDKHVDDNTGHVNSVISASEPADGTLDNNEGAFWYELT